MHRYETNKYTVYTILMIESRLRCMDVYCKILSNLLYLRFFQIFKIKIYDSF